MIRPVMVGTTASLDLACSSSNAQPKVPRLAVLDPEQTPYCVASSDDELNSVLTREWDHELILSVAP